MTGLKFTIIVVKGKLRQSLSTSVICISSTGPVNIVTLEMNYSSTPHKVSLTSRCSLRNARNSNWPAEHTHLTMVITGYAEFGVCIAKLVAHIT